MIFSKKLERARYTAFIAWGAIGVLVLVAAALWGLGRVSSALTPLVIAMLLTFILRPIVDKLESFKVPRAWGALIAFTAFVAAWVLASSLLFPPIGRQISGLIADLPRYVREATDFVMRLSDSYAQLQLSDSTEELIAEAGKEVSAWATSVARSSGTALIAGASGVLGFAFNLLISFILTYWLLRDSRRMFAELKVLAGERWGDDFDMLAKTVSRVLGGYMKGMLITSTCTGLIAGIGYSLLGMPYALILGILTGLFNVIPIVGPWIGGLIAGLVALFVSPMTAVFAGLITIGAQQIVDLLISPRVMSRQVALHPVLIIVSLLVGGTLFGIVGTIVAVPVAATLKGVFVYYFERRTRRQLTSDDGVLFPSCHSDGSDECEKESV